MITESWRIASEHGGRRWWWVRVHDSQAALQESAHRYAPWNGRDFWNERTQACCQPAPPLISEDDDPTNPTGELIWPAYGFAGVIRLHAECLYTEVIYHEVLHAACATYRMNIALSIDLGNGHGGMEREEDLAYIYGQLAADMDTALHERMK